MAQVKVEGMTCGGCVRSVEKAVKAATGAADVAVDLASGLVSVPDGTDTQAVITAIEEAGFAAKAA